MNSHCIYTGVAAESIYQVDLSQHSSHVQISPVQCCLSDAKEENVEDQNMTSAVTQKAKGLEINYSNLCFIGWRLLVIHNNRLNTIPKSEAKDTSVTYYRQHICVVCEVPHRAASAIKCLCLRRDCALEHPAVQCQGKLRGVSSTDDLLLYYTDEGALWHLTDIVNPSPQRILLSDRKVRQVSCGKEHTVILTTLGQVYTFGGGSRGQLGHGCLQSLKEPRVVDTLSGISVVEVRAGGWHTLVLSDIGDVYGWGWNESGQVGMPCLKDEHGSNRPSGHNGQSMVVFPSLLFEDDVDITIVDIGCGSRHSAAVTDDGRLYAWGWNAYGQLLLDTNISVQDVPRLAGADSKLYKAVKCGGWSTFAYFDLFTQGTDNPNKTDL